jgi:hypothetical protein
MRFLALESAVNENNRRLLIIALVVLVLLFILLGLIGMAIRKVMQEQGKRIDQEVSDAVRFRIIDDEKHFRRYASIKSRRLFVKQACWPILIAFVSLLFYIIYAASTNGWSENYWGEFGTLFYQWDFGNEDCYATFWGMRLLASWPPLSNTPHFVAEYYAAYVLCTLWLVSSIWFFVASQAYLSRMVMINRRAKSIYNKSLEGYNYYDTMAYPDAAGVPGAAPQQAPQGDPNNPNAPKP